MSLHALNTFAIRTRKLARTTLATALIAGLALPATAQTVKDDAAMPDTSLNVPEGLTIFGQQDPNVRRATPSSTARSSPGPISTSGSR